MLGMREKVEAIANPLPKNIVAIANGDPTPPDLLIPMLSPQPATFRIIELGPFTKFRNNNSKSTVTSPVRLSDGLPLEGAEETAHDRVQIRRPNSFDSRPKG